MLVMVTLLAIFFAIAMRSIVGENFKIDDEDGSLLTNQLITKYGYDAEEHEVKTADGYLLTMFRMRQRKGEVNRTPVFFMHGLLGSSSDYLLLGPNHAIAYLLANDGYDVWLGNARGNRYSRKHVQLLPSSKEFWDFSWHEIGVYDLPAMIDYALERSSAKKLFYVGFSQGGTAYFVMTSVRPEYNGKILLAHTLAPAVYIDDIRTPLLRPLIDNFDTTQMMVDRLSVHELLPHLDSQYTVYWGACLNNDMAGVCANGYQQLCGPNPNRPDTKALMMLLGNFPSGASINQLLHYGQVNRLGVFQSRLKPGQCAKQYNISASTAPVIIYYSENDWLVHPKNVERFSGQLLHLVQREKLSDQNFNHIDFLLANNAKKLVYEKLRQNINNTHM